MDTTPQNSHDMTLLEHIEIDPDISQASLAQQLGVAVGTVNWHLKRLVSKGYVKVKRAQRKKLRYIITPEGISLRARLTIEYVERSMNLYRITRKRIVGLICELREAGYDSVHISGSSSGPDDLVDICRLTCLEQNISLVDDPIIPILRIKGKNIELILSETITDNTIGEK
jgi:DNA-binding MarR family transcriptional regulator